MLICTTSMHFFVPERLKVSTKNNPNEHDSCSEYILWGIYSLVQKMLIPTASMQFDVPKRLKASTKDNLHERAWFLQWVYSLGNKQSSPASGWTGWNFLLLVVYLKYWSLRVLTTQSLLRELHLKKSKVELKIKDNKTKSREKNKHTTKKNKTQREKNTKVKLLQTQRLE